MRRKLVTLLATSIAALALSAPAQASVALGTPAPASAPTTYDDYVALGDSYTAGPLIPIETPGPLGCVRSSANYPAFLASYFKVKTFTDVSCSAARTHHLWDAQTAVLPAGLPENLNAPQLLAVAEQTDLVTLGIGGNDFNLFGELIDQCARAAADHPDAVAPCKDKFTVDGVDTKLRDATRIQAHIEKALVAIREKAPHAKIVVVGYLHILPESGTCAAIPFAPGDYVWGTSIHKRLNASLRNAATDHGATYVDMYAASAGHDACAPAGQAWVNGATIKPLQAMSFHPFRLGMKNIAGTIYHQLTGRAAPFALPTLSLLKRLPSLIDVPALLTWLGSVSSQVTKLGAVTFGPNTDTPCSPVTASACHTGPP